MESLLSFYVNLISFKSAQYFLSNICKCFKDKQEAEEFCEGIPRNELSNQSSKSTDSIVIEDSEGEQAEDGRATIRYPKRNVARKNYTEPDVPDDDHFICKCVR